MIDDFIIVGGGLIGLLTARELRASGARVTVIDRGLCGGEASWAGGGILSPLYPWRYPQPVTALAQWGQQAYPYLAEALTEEAGIDAEWTPSGMLILAVSAAECVLARRWAEHHQQRIEWPTGAQIAALEPALADAESPSSQTALWMPEVAQIRSPRLLRALRVSLIQQGVRVLEGLAVRQMLRDARRVVGVLTDAGAQHAGAVVIAGGAWSAALLKPLGITLPLAPVRGQIILFRASPALLTRMVMRDHRYLIPRRDGRILAGSTLEHVGFDPAITPAAATRLQRAALQLLPELEDFPIEQQWSGLRPGTISGVPFIGAHPDVAGLYVCAGHHRNGIVLAPASARLLADLALVRAPIVAAAPYGLPATAACLS